MNSSCEKEAQLTLVVERFSELLAFLCYLNALSAIVATVGNSLVLITMWRTRGLRSPSYVLLSGLALSDLGVGLIAQPIFVGFNAVLIHKKYFLYFHIFKVYFPVTDMLFAATISTLCAVTFDRLLALRLHLRYQELVTVRRTLFFLSSIWVVNAAYTVWMANHRSSAKIFQLVSLVIFLFFILSCNVTIFKTLRYHQSQIQSQAAVSQQSAGQFMPSITRYKKSVRSMLYIVGLFFVCYLPWVCYHAAAHASDNCHTVSIFIAERFLTTLTYLNSSLNPFLYCWQIGELRQAVKATLKV